jgi:hypothetical protein
VVDGNDEFHTENSQHTARFRAGTNLPAKTGNDNNNNIAVTKIAHTNNGNLCKLIPLVLIFKVVLMTVYLVNFLTKWTIFSSLLI